MGKWTMWFFGMALAWFTGLIVLVIGGQIHAEVTMLMVLLAIILGLLEELRERNDTR